MLKLIIKRGLSILILLFACIGGIQAQRDYREGYIITHEWDTVYGWVDYRGDIRNSQVCSFKESENGQATDYSPWDIVGYRYNDSKFYISKNVGSDDAPKRVFLEYLVNGMASLYYYKEDNVNKHYYIENFGQLHELKIDEQVVEIEGVVRVRKINSYVGVLQATLNVWEMRDEIGKAKLEHSSLINIAKNYHQYTCTDGSECIIYRSKHLMALRIGPVVGANLSNLKMMEGVFFQGDDGIVSILDKKYYKFDPSTNFTVGVNMNLSMPRVNEKLFLQMQAIYTKYYFFRTYESYISATDVHVSSNALQMGLAFKYEYPRGKWRPTLAAGGVLMWLPDGSIKEITDRYSLDLVRSSSEQIDFQSKFMYGFEITPGVHYYLANDMIVFVQAQYLHYYKSHTINGIFSTNKIRSLGLSAGIYF